MVIKVSVASKQSERENERGRDGGRKKERVEKGRVEKERVYIEKVSIEKVYIMYPFLIKM